MPLIVVFILCALASLACAFLLLRSYRTTRLRLLLWSGLCFVGLFLNNLLLVIDVHALVDLSVWRSLPAVGGVMLLVYGLVWETAR